MGLCILEYLLFYVIINSSFFGKENNYLMLTFNEPKNIKNTTEKQKR